jgi:hypothetical protein
MTNYNYEMQRQTLIDYLQLMVSRADWHGVSDAANDLRVLEAENRSIDADLEKGGIKKGAWLG